METTPAIFNIFLVILSLGLTVVFVLVAVFLFYLITTLFALKRVVNNVEKNIHRIGDASKYLIEDVRNNKAFKFLFRKNKKHH